MKRVGIGLALSLGLALVGCAEVESAPDRLVLSGSVNLLPGPDAPFRPSLAELLIAKAGPDAWLARASGNAEGIALLCGRDKGRQTLEDPAQAALFDAVDAVLITRAPAEVERADCAKRSIDIAARQLARYTGAGAFGIEGIWIVWAPEAMRNSPALERLVDTARRDTARLLESSAYAPLFEGMNGG
ncbi:MAG: hypothetical protein AAGC92_16745 [Pseudomonadota bacterium]